MTKERLNVRIAHFSGCSGCQLMLLNCEPQLALLADRINCFSATMMSSSEDTGGPCDLLLVEGSINTPDEQMRLRDLRSHARILVAVGACALTGGINRLDETAWRNGYKRVYGKTAGQIDAFPPQPLAAFVRVDAEIPGCPPERNDFLDFFGALSRHGHPLRREIPVCMECRIRENRCLLETDRCLCLGPLTLGGCAARCPSFGVPCEGCRGEVAEACRDALWHLLEDAGWTVSDLRARLQRFSRGKP